MDIQFSLSSSRFENEDGKKVWKNAFILDGISYDIFVEIEGEDMSAVCVPVGTTQKTADAWKVAYQRFPSILLQHPIVFNGRQITINNQIILHDKVFYDAFACFNAIRVI